MNTLTWKFARNMTGGNGSPVLTLETWEQTLAYLAGPQLAGMDKYRVCSLPLCDLMDEMEKTAYVYNTQACAAFNALHGTAYTLEGSTLSTLVYNCQGYRRARKLEVDGWEPCTREMLSEALRLKKRVQVFGESAFGSAVQESFAVRIWNGNGLPCAFRDKKRKPFGVVGMPCKLVAA